MVAVIFGRKEIIRHRHSDTRQAQWDEGSWRPLRREKNLSTGTKYQETARPTANGVAAKGTVRAKLITAVSFPPRVKALKRANLRSPGWEVKVMTNWTTVHIMTKLI
jgi:hypothetical protein